MTAPFFNFPCGARPALAIALTLLAGVAAAQTQDPVKTQGPTKTQGPAKTQGSAKPAAPETYPTPAPSNPLRAVTDFLNWTAEAGDGPDFVRESHPDTDKLNYSNLAGVDKKRAAVKKPEELKAAQDRLVAEREKSAAQARALQSEKVETPAPNKVEPIKDE